MADHSVPQPCRERTDQLRDGDNVPYGRGAGGRKRIHGGRANPEYGVWDSMIQRCTNPSNDQYKNYGGRGITVCDRWRRSFPDFLADMGPRPSSRHTLERIRNEIGYEPGNCRWALQAEQNRNRRGNRVVEIDGLELCLADAANLFRIAPQTLDYRLRRMSVEEATSLPVPKRRPRGENLIGQRFGRLEVLRKAAEDPAGKLWLCRCDCGAEIPVPRRRLISRQIETCGCRSADLIQFRGERKSLRQWAEEFGLGEVTVRMRIKSLGWSLEKALTTPARKLATKRAP